MEKVISEGRLSFDFRFAALLAQVQEGKQPGITLLRLSNFESGEVGEIAFKKGRFIAGAEIKGKRRQADHSGYEALRRLCEVTTADYVYVQDPHRLPELTLNIELQRVINMVPGLPEDQAVLQNDEVLLNLIFNPNATSDCIPASPLPLTEIGSTSSDNEADEWIDSEISPEPKARRSTFESLESRAIKESASTAAVEREKDERTRSQRKTNVPQFAHAVGGGVRWLAGTAMPLFLSVLLIGAIAQCGIYVFGNSAGIVQDQRPRNNVARTRIKTRPRNVAVSRSANNSKTAVISRSSAVSKRPQSDRVVAGPTTAPRLEGALLPTVSIKTTQSPAVFQQANVTGADLSPGANSTLNSNAARTDTSAKQSPRRRAYQTY